MKRRGFTIVELLIAITVMGILLVIAVVALSSSQRNARDDERRADIQAIAAALEDYYNGSNAAGTTGRYPTTAIAGSESNINGTLRDISISTFTAPGVSTPGTSFVAATNADQTLAGVTPQPTTGTYVYQPLLANGTLCSGSGAECRKYNLFYLPENGSATKVTSRHQ